MGNVITAMRVGEERLRAVGNPFHRTTDALRRPQRYHLFRVNKDFRTETAADVRRDDAKFMLGSHADERGNDQTGQKRLSELSDRELLELKERYEQISRGAPK